MEEGEGKDSETCRWQEEMRDWIMRQKSKGARVRKRVGENRHATFLSLKIHTTERPGVGISPVNTTRQQLIQAMQADRRKK